MISLYCRDCGEVVAVRRPKPRLCRRCGCKLNNLHVWENDWAEIKTHAVFCFPCQAHISGREPQPGPAPAFGGWEPGWDGDEWGAYQASKHEQEHRP